MTQVKVRYFVEKPGANGPRFYWQPSAALRARGWQTIRLHDDKTAASSLAQKINCEVDIDRPTRRHLLAPTKKKQPGIYVIGTDTGHLKIGITSNPVRRVNDLQIATPDKLDLLFFVRCKGVVAQDIERHTHNLLRNYRTKGEWFNVPLDKAIDTILQVVRWKPVD